MINKARKYLNVSKSFSVKVFEGIPRFQPFVACFIVFNLCIGVLCELKEKRVIEPRERGRVLSGSVCDSVWELREPIERAEGNFFFLCR